MKHEAELVKGCRAGQESARRKLYSMYAEQLLAVCYRYTGDMDAAHDVLHDGFIKIFTKFTFREEASLKTWLVKVMMTQAIDYLRKQQRMSGVFASDEALPELPDLQEEHVSDISEETLLSFVADLPPGCRTVFNLYVFEERSHKEIAEMLGIKEHSSTSQLHRARYLLANRIKEYRTDEARK